MLLKKLLEIATNSQFSTPTFQIPQLRNLEAFKHLIIVFVAFVVFAEDSGTSHGMQFAPLLKTSVYIPTDEKLHSYVMVGGGVRTPATIKNVDFLVEAGVGEMKLPGDRYMQVLHLSVGCMIKNPIRLPYLEIDPFIALTSMMVGNSRGKIEAVDTHLFSEVENEFGVCAGMLPQICWNRFLFTVPIRFERIFSYPETYSNISFSLAAGYLFDL